ncbi:nicotinate (nicotinamide) nucleotide adenylyltransferase [Pelistega ratti]|uniref:nicotinate (nicotinamide) nucleotide adenylyltransferase n=1 Tax=Pelistega ratti TaxID=2652177 RepID=UPI001FA9D303|nr:nicotinate (nicotinamide) nucleotide adenylyltransferase [Pelistega ratti]
MIPKIGLLGGSFNPFHLAHLHLALAAIQHLDLNEVQFIPAGQPWQKKGVLDASHRLAILSRSIQDIPKLSINTIEIERDGPSYTIDTVKALPIRAKYYWLMGTDQLNNFCTWHQWASILQYVQLVIIKRPHYDITAPQALQEELQKQQKSLIFLPFDEINLSSTMIRNKLMAHEDVSAFMHPDALQYIKQHHLYQ